MDLSLSQGTFDALIFDCDGTLVDTPPAHLRALQKALAPLQLTMAAEWYYERGGLGPNALWDQYEALQGKPIPRESITERYNEIFRRELDQMEEIRVVADIARAWHGRVPLSVASNGRRANVKATLAATGLLPLFDHVVGAEDVKHGKPEPDVFLEAARRMSVAPVSCVVFEDSDEGLEAARRAGMRAMDIRAFHTPAR
ncbi:MAG: HAD family phosphatase [Acidobacteriota bacterium]|nr:HAD family phosphatase [Acidobacteriota bacterium]